jgi:hypothetical protein
MNNNLLEEEAKPSYKTKVYWGRKSKKLTSTRLEEEKLGTKVTAQSKKDLKEDFNCSTLDS